MTKLNFDEHSENCSSYNSNFIFGLKQMITTKDKKAFFKYMEEHERETEEYIIVSQLTQEQFARLNRNINTIAMMILTPILKAWNYILEIIVKI